MGRGRDLFGGLATVASVALAFGAGPVLGASWERQPVEFTSNAEVAERAPVVLSWPLPEPAPAEPAAVGADPGPVAALPVGRPVPAAPAPGGAAAARRTDLAERSPPEVVARSRERCPDPDGEDIVKTGAAQWTVHRDVIRRYSRDWGSLDQLGWSRPHEAADGRKDGMLIGGVRCGSDLHRVGLRAGDVVHRVNGREVRNLPQALLVYAAVRNDPTVAVEISRKGERRTLTYRLIG